MIGWTHICVGTLITRRYGAEIWAQIKRKAGFSEETEFEVQTYYDDTETMRIFRTAASVLGAYSKLPTEAWNQEASVKAYVEICAYFMRNYEIERNSESHSRSPLRYAKLSESLSVDDLWEMYGDHLITYACETGWEKMLTVMANNLQEFLDNLNSMHYFIDQIAFKSEMRGPTFHCEPQGDSGLRLHYFSHRQGLFPIVKGLVRKTARVLYDMEVTVNVLERSQERRKSGMMEHVLFSIEPDDDHKAGRRMAYKFRREPKMIDGSEGLSMPVALKDLVHIFPYHICFNKQLLVEHVGNYLLKEYGLADKKMLKLSELVQLVQPSDIQLTHKNIIAYLNTIFIFQVKHHAKRNEIEKGSSEAFQQPLCLKGQMMSVNGGQSVIFLCSPHVTTVRDILDLNLFISDMPMHDATRDLVMLNQSRICQMELNKKLEETVRNLKGLADQLEKKKAQTDQLLYEFVPVAIADAFRQNKPVPAQEFQDCTVLFADVPDFFTINVNCKPHEVIDLVTDLFHRFDRLIDINKVLSLMDSYMVVGGVPQASQLHCEAILNLALGLVFEGKQVKVPGMNLPVRVRVGVHTGPVVAGIVSHKKPRYCVLGQTVVVTKAVINQSQPGKILVTNAVRTTVTKHLKSIFVFSSAGFLEIGNAKVLTHFLEKNEQLSAWDIIKAEKGPESSIDGYKELHSIEGAAEWDEARMVAIRQQSVVDALSGVSRKQRALQRLRSVKRRFRAAQSNDSGISLSEPTLESTVCSMM